MEPLQWNILKQLATAKEHCETNINLKPIWKVCGSVEPAEFAQAWGTLAAGELVHGELYVGAGSIGGLGKITAKGEEELKKSPQGT